MGQVARDVAWILLLTKPIDELRFRTRKSRRKNIPACLRLMHSVGRDLWMVGKKRCHRLPHPPGRYHAPRCKPRGSAQRPRRGHGTIPPLPASSHHRCLKHLAPLTATAGHYSLTLPICSNRHLKPTTITRLSIPLAACAYPETASSELFQQGCIITTHTYLCPPNRREQRRTKIIPPTI